MKVQIEVILTDDQLRIRLSEQNGGPLRGLQFSIPHGEWSVDPNSPFGYLMARAMIAICSRDPNLRDQRLSSEHPIAFTANEGF